MTAAIGSMDQLTTLGLAALAWVALHRGIAGSRLRFWLVDRLGEGAYRALFSTLSVLALGVLIWAYRRAPCAPLWITPRPLLYLPILVMPAALTLLAGAFVVKNPTAVGGESALGGVDPVRGVLRITRHPFLAAVTLWSGVHWIVNGNQASLLFFGAMFLSALWGMRDIDRKRRRTHGEAWASYAKQTSVLPFAAIIGSRNRLVLRELGVPLLLGAAASGLFVALHQSLFHVRALP